MQSKKGFSIIICTRNRFDLLQEAVRSLIYQIRDRLDVELIIVDNDSSDQTKKLLINNITDFEYEYLHIGDIGIPCNPNSKLYELCKQSILHNQPFYYRLVFS